MLQCNNGTKVTYLNYNDFNCSWNGSQLGDAIERYLQVSPCQVKSQMVNSEQTVLEFENSYNFRRVSTKFASFWKYNNIISISTTNADGVALMTPDKSSNLNTLVDIALLRDDWNENGAKAFSNELLKRCRELILKLTIQPDIYPTAEESIQFEWEKPNGDYLEVEIFEDFTCRKYLEKCDGTQEMDVIDITMVGDLVDRFFA